MGKSYYKLILTIATILLTLVVYLWFFTQIFWKNINIESVHLKYPRNYSVDIINNNEMTLTSNRIAKEIKKETPDTRAEIEIVKYQSLNELDGFNGEKNIFEYLNHQKELSPIDFLAIDEVIINGIKSYKVEGGGLTTNYAYYIPINNNILYVFDVYGNNEELIKNMVQ